VVAAFARGATKIKNVAHLKDKESDRLSATAAELSKLGIDARCQDAGLVIQGGVPHGGRIDTHADHRLAMSFAVAGLKVPGVVIQDETCVEKSFPDFWRVFNNM
jgi:3-phosphoshikimate 1-carboxyvinyltransferase